ncbi:hypothetical protein ACJMK2_023169 [Sinanodonta woodiana]|uniref:Chitin-binding type-2 domain-containing protein n=1 Tax=Sinanodonta woodiana TaxID=1069815 RepID=A0ABD3T4M9_SINWO
MFVASGSPTPSLDTQTSANTTTAAMVKPKTTSSTAAVANPPSLSTGNISAIQAAANEYYRITVVNSSVCHEFGCTEPTCKVPYRNDCRNYIDCVIESFAPEVRYKAILMDCGFGTFWDQAQYTCVHVKNATCEFSVDKCSISGKPTIDHRDDNCRTHWICTEGRSYPACCPPGLRYDDVSGQCVEDPDCVMPCPINFKKEDPCSLTNRPSVDLVDNNCRTYWTCMEGRSFPACCPPDNRYDDKSAQCLNDSTCKQSCPIIDDLCADSKKISYSYNDNNCRTYIYCGSGQPQPACCPWGFRYDNQSQNCLLDSSCDHEICPDQFIEIKTCLYEKYDPEGRYFYIRGHQPQPCSPTVLFNETTCGCTIPRNQSTAGCKIDLNITFHQGEMIDKAENTWLETSASLKLPNQQEPYATFRNGDSAILVRKYDHVALDKVFTKLSFIPDTASTTDKQILISNCRTKASSSDSPSFDVRLDPSGILITIKTDSDSANLTLPYQKGIKNTLYISYDLQRVVARVETVDPSTKQIKSSEKEQSLQDKIIAGIVPLMIGACEYTAQKYSNGFYGKIDEIVFARCVVDGMMPVNQEQ